MILLTGATGLLGAHLLRIGLARGQRFRAATRSLSARSYLAAVGGDERVQVANVELTTDPFGAELFAGVDTVIHAAALASPFPADEARMKALNVDATERLFARAIDAGVRQWVQVSSVATLSGSGAVPVTERDETPRDTVYARTKWLADRYLRTQAHRAAILTVHPTFMLGPWDARPSSGSLLLALRMKRLRHYVECVKNVVAAADVATGIFRALERGVTGGHYLLGGADVRMSELLGAASRAIGIDASSLVELSALPTTPTAEVKEGELHVLRELCTSSPSSSAKAAQDFGYAPTTNLEALVNETARWLEDHRLLPKKRARGEDTP